MFPRSFQCVVNPLDRVEIQPSPPLGAVHVLIEQSGGSSAVFIGAADIAALIDALLEARDALASLAEGAP